MVVVSCLRILVRKILLRKGVLISLVCLSLLGSLLLYNLHVSDNYDRDVRRITLPSPVTSSNRANAHSESLPRKSDLSQNNHKQPINFPGDQKQNSEIVVLAENLPECVFSASQPEDGHVDIMVSAVSDQLPFEDPMNPTGWNQGFDIRYSMEDFRDEPLQVFVVPHSHNDPGWLKTFEGYYKAQTRNILNLMTDALSQDKRKKFIWAEISYLDLWWAEQGEERRNKFRNLVANGQIEIVTGGWVMNDEANPHYFAMLDQLFEGHQWLSKNLPGVKPTTGWAIDPFGYTSTMPYLLQGTGIESMLIQRVHYALKKHFAFNKQLEFGWQQQWDLGYDSGIFCHMMPFYSYDVPHTCGPNPKICCQFDFLRLPGGRVNCPWRVNPVAITDDNVAVRSEMLADQYRMKSKLFQTNILLVPLGDDFRWDSQKEIDNQFTNYFKLMDHMNSHPEMKINVKFGTLSEYFEAVRSSGAPDRRNSLVPQGFPLLAGDFFTYADRADHYWSGYYTSRPFHKNMDRVLQHYLRLAEIMYSVVISRDIPLDARLEGVASQLTNARRNLGLFQHHDGITGTAKDPVVIDYAKRVLSSVQACQGIISASVKSLTAVNNPNSVVDFVSHEVFELNRFAQKSPISVSNEKKMVTFVNPLPQVARQLVTVVVDTPSVAVHDSNNTSLDCQLSPVLSNMEISSNQFRLSFHVIVPALGTSHYMLSQRDGGACTRANVQIINSLPFKNDVFSIGEVSSVDDFLLSTPTLEAKFSGTTGLLKSMSTGSSAVETELEFVMYGTASGKDKSGAYLFLPGGEAKPIISSWAKPPISIVVGPLLQEVTTNIQSGLVLHTVQLGTSPDGGIDGRPLSIINLVDITKEANKEVAMRIRTSVKNPREVFYSDENGFQMIRRRTYSKLPLQGNVYPMPSSAFLQDSDHRVTLFTGQPLGVASLKQGWLEVILDRKLMQDDNRGLAQGVKDSVLTLEPFRLLVERRMTDKTPTPDVAYHSLVGHATLDGLLYPLVTLSSRSPPLAPAPKSALTKPFPCDVHLVNLRSVLDSPTAESALILHRRGFDCGFDTGKQQCSLVDGQVRLGELFKATPSNVLQTTLTLLHDKAALSADSAFITSIKPMEIHTYKLSW